MYENEAVIQNSRRKWSNDSEQREAENDSSSGSSERHMGLWSAALNSCKKCMGKELWHERLSGIIDPGGQPGGLEDGSDIRCGCGLYRWRNFWVARESKKFLNGGYERGNCLCACPRCQGVCDGQHPGAQPGSGRGAGIFSGIEGAAAGCSDHCGSGGLWHCHGGLPGDRAAYQHPGQ